MMVTGVDQNLEGGRFTGRCGRDGSSQSVAYQQRNLPKRMRVLAVEQREINADRNGQRGQGAKHAAIVIPPD
jgi:hypothetical protein